MMRWVEKALQVWRRTIGLTTAPTLLSPPLTGTGEWAWISSLQPSALPALQLSRIKELGGMRSVGGRGSAAERQGDPEVMRTGR